MTHLWNGKEERPTLNYPPTPSAISPLVAVTIQHPGSNFEGTWCPPLVRRGREGGSRSLRPLRGGAARVARGVQRVRRAGGPPRGGSGAGRRGVQGAQGSGEDPLLPWRRSGAGGSPEDAAQHILHMSSEEEEV